MLKGRIIKNISNSYTVLQADNTYECKACGKFRKEGLTPLVGDKVEFDEQKHYILKILPRTNYLDRPPISNVDYALIITSLKKPDLSFNLLDKEISSILLANITPLICFTKLDLASAPELAELKSLRAYYEKIGLKTFTNKELSSLTTYLKDKFIVLTGQTGAGKSTLINKLDSTKNLATAEISFALNRGKHTTRHTEFYKIKDFYIADTPGFSSLSLTSYSKADIAASFQEFQNYTCEYRDCLHLEEPNCEVKKAVEKGEILASRYESYCSFIRGIK